MHQIVIDWLLALDEQEAFCWGRALKIAVRYGII